MDILANGQLTTHLSENEKVSTVKNVFRATIKLAVFENLF